MNSTLRLNCYHPPIKILRQSKIVKQLFNGNDFLVSCSRSFNVQKQQQQSQQPSQPRKIPQKTIRTVNIFDRETKILQREWAARSADVDVYDYVKDEIGYRLADRIFDIKRKFTTVINLGCSRSYVAKHVTSDSVENLIMTDNSEFLLSHAFCNDPNVKLKKLVCDEEKLSEVFQPETAEMVITSLALHWVNDLPGCFKQVMDILKIDGVFLGSMFGIDTLYELRSSLQLAESERKGGISPHISPFTKPTDIGHLLQAAGFTMQTIDVDEIVVRYPTMFELMEDLKGMGESNASWNRSLHISRDTLLAASVIYEQLYSKTKLDEGEDATGIPATFQTVYFIAWKPDPSKPLPEPKDPAMVSLRDYYKIDELSVDGLKKINLDE